MSAESKSADPKVFSHHGENGLGRFVAHAHRRLDELKAQAAASLGSGVVYELRAKIGDAGLGHWLYLETSQAMQSDELVNEKRYPDMYKQPDGDYLIARLKTP